MTGRLAIIAGEGRLPGLLAGALAEAGTPPLVCEMEQFPTGISAEVERFRVERLAMFLDRLHDLGVGRVIFAGAMQRPKLDPALFDPRTAQMVPRLVGAMQAGDDATLREVVGIFEEDGFKVVGAHVVLPDLLPAPGILGQVAPTERDLADSARGAEIVAALGAVDVGQGAVVANGLCLAVETLPGTDVMLEQVAAFRQAHPGQGSGGVFYKSPKPGQEWRIDLPALGPDTIPRVRAAGLSGIAFQVDGVLVIDRKAMVAAADEAGIFLWARES